MRYGNFPFRYEYRKYNCFFPHDISIWFPFIFLLISLLYSCVLSTLQLIVSFIKHSMFIITSHQQLNIIISFISGLCPSGTFACDNGTTCLPQRFVCDKVPNCLDLQDEEKAECSHFYGSIEMTKNIYDRALYNMTKRVKNCSECLSEWYIIVVYWFKSK